MKKAFGLGIVAAALALGLAACGGSEEEASSSDDTAALTGTWTSSALGASWTFYSDNTGQLRQVSTDGGSCQITDIEFTVDSSSQTITYYGTRYRMTGNTPYNYDETVRKGPYSTGYQLSNGSVTIGAGTYSASSGSAC